VNTRPLARTTIPVTLVILTLIAALGMANARFSQSAQDANEFLPRWEGASAWLTDGLSPYDPQVSLSAQRRLYGRAAIPAQGEDLALFAYPFPTIVLYAPWAALEYPVARAGWMTLLEILLVVAAMLAVWLAGWRPPPLLLAALLAFGVGWSPGIQSIVSGNLAILALAFSLAAVASIERGWDVLGGILLALALADPIVGLLAFLVGLAWAAPAKRWRVLGAALGTAGLVCAVSLGVMPDWPLAWLRQIAGWAQTAGADAGLPILSWGWAPAVLAGLLALAVLWAVWSGWGKGTRWLVWNVAFSLVLGDWFIRLALGSSPGVYLLPAVVLILAGLGQRVRTKAAWAVAGAMALIGFGSWIPYFTAAPASAGGVILGSAGNALAAFGLLWVRWWVTRGAEIRDLSPEEAREG
jgi:hypothetical protein